MSKAVEIINALISPANKLIDAVTGAIGKAYQPRHIRKIAEAKVHEINVIGQALRDNADVPIVYDKGELSLNTTDFDEFVKRTQSRLAYQELQKQQNIENVADKAYDLLSTETECSSEPVSQDWMTRFFNSVEDISDEDMQTLWARILAGEIKKPNSYSLRTLEALRNLSKEEALHFQTICKYRIITPQGSFLPNDENLLHTFGINYDSILLMEECGLLNSSGLIIRKESVTPEKSSKFSNGQVCLLVKSKENREIRLDIGNFPFTSIGHELATMLGAQIDNASFVKFAQRLQKTNNNIEFNVFRYIPISNDMVRTFGEDLLNIEKE